MRNLLIALFGLVSVCAAAQNGTIAGTVAERDNSDAPAFGAIISVDSTRLGAQADFDGKFKISVPAGTYNVRCQYTGYIPVMAKTIVVVAGKTTTVDFPLTDHLEIIAGDSGGVVEIIAIRPTQSQATVLQDIKNGDNTTDGQGQGEIKQSVATDAGQVARRIPGVTLVGDRFVIVRGLSERYNSVLLNNVIAPSVESDVKAFSFNLVPSAMIDRFMIYKSPSPDLPGEFSGGVIRISTTEIPAQTSWSINYQAGYRSTATFQPFTINKGDSRDLIASGAASRGLPAGFPANVRDLMNDPDATQSIGQSLNNNWGLTTTNAPVDTRFSTTFSYRLSKPKFQFGNITSVNYSNTYQHVLSDRLDYNVYDTINNHPDTIFHFTDNIFTNSVRVAFVQNNAFRFGKVGQHRVSIKNLFNQTGDNETTLRTGIHSEFGDYRKEYSYRYTQKSLYTGQLGGEHEFNSGSTRLDWTVAYSAARSKDPDWRRARYSKPLSSGPDDPYTFYLSFSAQPFFLGRIFINMNEDAVAGTFNIEQDVTIGKDSATKDNGYTFVIKAGSYYDQKDRTFNVRNIGYKAGSSATFGNYDLFLLPIDQIFTPENINNVDGLAIDEDTKKADSYLAANRLIAGYLMGKFPIGKFKGPYDGENHERVRISGGVRIENNLQTLNSNTIPGDTVIVNNNITRVLPSINIAFNLTDRMLIRGAYGKTLNRPEFREIAPLYFYDFVFNSINTGNPDLKTPSIDNYDLRWEFYPRSGENITFGAFYKRFMNPIEVYFVPGIGSGGTRSFTWANAYQAQNYGLEIEVRKKLDSIDVPIIRNLSVIANASVIKSIIDLNEDSLGSSTSQRPMMGQSPWIINAGLYYQNDSIGLQINAMYNVIGPRVVIAGIPDIPAVWEMPRHQFDVAIIKTFGKNRNVDVRLNIADILNQQFLLLQDANGDGELNRDNDQALQYYKRGTYVTFGLTVRLLEPKRE